MNVQVIKQGLWHADDALRWRILHALLVAFAFCVPLSIALAEPLGLIAAVLGLFLYGQEGARRPCRSTTWWLLAFIGVNALASLLGDRTGLAMKKAHCLLLPVLIPVFALAMKRQPNLARAAIGAFLAGTVLLACYDVVRIPWQTFVWHRDLFDAGNMRDPQFYAVALCLVIGPYLARSRPWGRSWYAVATLAGLGLLLHFKRGAWLAFMGVCVLGALLTRRWKLPVLVLLLACSALLLPGTRARLEQLRDVVHIEKGGRMLLWTKVAPQAIREHPWGMGYRVVRHEDLLAIHSGVEAGLNHLHNNLLQVTLESGWLGAFIWSGWMLSLLWVLGRSALGQHKSAHTLGLFCALCFLLLNGVVEYNIGDTEILMLFSLVCGLGLGLSESDPEALSATTPCP